MTENLPDLGIDDDVSDLVLVDVTVTCATPDCENQGIPISLDVPEGTTTFVCGACGNQVDLATVLGL